MSEVNTIENEAFQCFRQAVLEVPDFPPAEFFLTPYEAPLCELESVVVPSNDVPCDGLYRAACEVSLSGTVDVAHDLRIKMVRAMKRADSRLFYWPTRLVHLVSSSLMLYERRVVVGSIVFGVRSRDFRRKSYRMEWQSPRIP